MTGERKKENKITNSQSKEKKSYTEQDHKMLTGLLIGAGVPLAATGSRHEKKIASD